LQAELDEKMKLLSRRAKTQSSGRPRQAKGGRKERAKRKEKQARLRTLRKFKRKH